MPPYIHQAQTYTPILVTKYAVIIGLFLIKHTRLVRIIYQDQWRVWQTAHRRNQRCLSIFVKRVSNYNNYFEIVSSYDQDLHLTAMVDWRGYRVHPLKLQRDANGGSYMAVYDKHSNQRTWSLKRDILCQLLHQTSLLQSHDTSYLVPYCSLGEKTVKNHDN